MDTILPYRVFNERIQGLQISGEKKKKKTEKNYKNIKIQEFQIFLNSGIISLIRPTQHESKSTLFW